MKKIFLLILLLTSCSSKTPDFPNATELNKITEDSKVRVVKESVKENLVLLKSNMERAANLGLNYASVVIYKIEYDGILESDFINKLESKGYKVMWSYKDGNELGELIVRW